MIATRRQPSRIVLASALATAVLALPPGAATAAGAATAGAADGLRLAAVTSLKLSTGQVEVSGLDVAAVVVDVELSSPDYDPDAAGSPITVNVVRAGGVVGSPTSWVHVVNLALTSGTRRNGRWRGVFHFPSASGGTWNVECVLTPGTWAAIPGQGGCADHGGVDYPSVTVIGDHVPALSAGVRPDPIRHEKAVVVSGRLTDGRTGRPLAGVGLEANALGRCDRTGRALAATRTADDGTYRMSLDPANGPAVCVYAPIQGPAGAQPLVHAATVSPLHFVPRVQARTTTARVPLTGTVRVVGRVSYVYAPTLGPSGVQPVLQLQRRTNGVWIAVATARPVNPWDFVLTARADARSGTRGGTRGVQWYRVVLPAQERFVRATSAVIPVRVT